MAQRLWRTMLFCEFCSFVLVSLFKRTCRLPSRLGVMSSKHLFNFFLKNSSFKIFCTWKNYAPCMGRKNTGIKLYKSVRRSYSKFLTPSNRETKAWRWNETKRTLFVANEVMALRPKTANSLWKQHWISKLLNSFHALWGIWGAKKLMKHRRCREKNSS